MKHLLIIFAAVQFLITAKIYADDTSEFFIQVKHSDYSAQVQVKNGSVFYQDKFRALSYITSNECSKTIVKYWLKDFKKLIMEKNDDKEKSRNSVRYRLDRTKSWSETSIKTRKGKVLLSLLTKIQRFELQQKRQCDIK